MGGGRQDPRLDELNHEVRGLGLEGRVHFIGPRSNPLEYIASFDVFALTSREDPYPLVCLEAATVGKPIVCFDGSGGEKEFVEDDCGFVVPYLDVEAMAEKVATLVDSPDLRHRFGAAAKRKVIERHDVSVAGSQICRVIENQLRSRAMTSRTSS
jgi:glycosyltransferase involved in cell wall biosynthesis